jgi:hypothetical protein
MGGSSGGGIPTTYGGGYTPYPKQGGGTEPIGGYGDPFAAPPTDPGDPSVTAPTQPWQPQQAYSTPTFGYTPYSPWAGLSQQIKGAMDPNLFGYAAPRTGLSDLAYSPWSMLYGGPSQTPIPGSLPSHPWPAGPGTVTPLPGSTPTGTGTPGAGTGSSGAGGLGGAGTQTGTGSVPGGTMGTQAPPPVPPPRTPTGGPPPPPGMSVPGGYPPAAGKDLLTPPVQPHHTAGFNAGMGLRDSSDDNTMYAGPNIGNGADAPGGLLRAMQDGGIDIRQTGMMRALMSAGRQGQLGGNLSNEQLVAATKQGAPADLMAGGQFKNGQWLDGSGNLIRGRGNQFNYRKRG